MARVVGVFNTAHSPFIYSDPAGWNDARAGRSLREDVPMDDEEGNRTKWGRVNAGFQTLREKLAGLNPDALVIFGDDQLECFDFNNFPSFAIYTGEEWEGTLANRSHRKRNSPLGGGNPRAPRLRQRLKGHPELAIGLLRGLMQRGCRMVHGHHQPAADPARPPVNAGNARVAEETRHREAPQGYDHLGVDRLDLPLQVI